MEGFTRKTSIKRIKDTIRKMPGVKSVIVSRLIYARKNLLSIFQISLDENEIQVEFDIDETSSNDILGEIIGLGFEAEVK